MDMSRSKAVKGFEELRAMQAAYQAAKAKAAPQAPNSPVSSSGGRPGSTPLMRQSSSSPESPVSRQVDSTAVSSVNLAAQEAPASKTARARLFKSGQSSPVDPGSPQAPAGVPEEQQTTKQQQQQLPDMLSSTYQQQQQPQKLNPQPSQQSHSPAAQSPKQIFDAQTAQAQQQPESMQQQQQQPFGPATLRNSILEQLTRGAPTSSSWPPEVKQFFKRLLDHSVEVSLEQHGSRDRLGRAEAQVVQVQDQLEYQAEQMMDLQSQVDLPSSKFELFPVFLAGRLPLFRSPCMAVDNAQTMSNHDSAHSFRNAQKYT